MSNLRIWPTYLTISPTINTHKIKYKRVATLGKHLMHSKECHENEIIQIMLTVIMFITYIIFYT